LNLAGVETVLRLEDELGRVRSRLERVEEQMRQEIRNVHRQYKREVVLYRGAGDETLPSRHRTSWTSYEGGRPPSSTPRG
jgi:hypothetical protein